ncbi:MAG TPA: CBS domain-containing protein [Kofleriaceae bacterium]
MQLHSVMLMLSVSRYMTRQPWTIRKDATMAQAHTMMRAHAIRHLPVLDGGALVGIVSERDLHLIETLPGGDPAVVTVEEAMVSDIHTAEPDDAVDIVVDHMAERKQGSAVVVDRHGAVLGIFTTIDALRVLADVLRNATE